MSLNLGSQIRDVKVLYGRMFLTLVSRGTAPAKVIFLWQVAVGREMALVEAHLRAQIDSQHSVVKGWLGMRGLSLSVLILSDTMSGLTPYGFG